MSTAKEIWNELKTIHEGIVQRYDSHIQMLRAMFARFRSLRGQSAMELTGRLLSIVDLLRQRGFDEISDRDVADKLLDSLEESYAIIILEIKE
jgi:hypothetical protein